MKPTRRVIWLAALVVLCAWLSLWCWRVSQAGKSPSLVGLVHAAIHRYHVETGEPPRTLLEVEGHLRELCRGATVTISSNGVGVFAIERRVANRTEHVTFRRRANLEGEPGEYYWTGD